MTARKACCTCLHVIQVQHTALVGSSSSYIIWMEGLCRGRDRGRDRSRGPIHPAGAAGGDLGLVSGARHTVNRPASEARVPRLLCRRSLGGARHSQRGRAPSADPHQKPVCPATFAGTEGEGGGQHQLPALRGHSRGRGQRVTQRASIRNLCAPPPLQAATLSAPSAATTGTNPLAAARRGQLIAMLDRGTLKLAKALAQLQQVSAPSVEMPCAFRERALQAPRK